MKKTLTEFVCSSCGYTSPKWLGKCPRCNEWNSLMEENKTNKQTDTVLWSDEILQKEQPINIKKIVSSKIDRIITKDKELNRVLGGGIVPGSVVLIGGEPGIGKSTLMLQITLSLETEKSLYVSGEESKEQIKIRSERLGEKHNNCFVLTETNLENILTILKKSKPDILIIDSIQTMKKQTIDATPGSISQIRECAHELIMYAKKIAFLFFLLDILQKTV
jgi:DNA repair protein RadA/Sms